MRGLFSTGGNAPALVLSFDRSAAASEARVIQSELSSKLMEPVHMAVEPGETIDLLMLEKPGAAVILLLTKDVFADQAAVHEVYHAIKNDAAVVPICVAGRGYDYASASSMLSNLTASWASPQEEADVHATLLSVVPNTISIDWRPEGGDNQTAAAVAEAAARIGLHRTEAHHQSTELLKLQSTAKLPKPWKRRHSHTPKAPGPPASTSTTFASTEVNV